jgi:hypothetical protein
MQRSIRRFSHPHFLSHHFADTKDFVRRFGKRTLKLSRSCTVSLRMFFRPLVKKNIVSITSIKIRRYFSETNVVLTSNMDRSPEAINQNHAV